MAIVYPATSGRPARMGYKDPNAVLDYAFLWVDWLDTDEIISAKTVTVTTGLTLVSSEVNNAELTIDGSAHKIGSVVTVWLSGGTTGQTYTVTCRITTNAGRIDDRSFYLNVRER